MRKIAKILCTSFTLLAVLWLGGVIADRQLLSSDLIRLHVVANSDSEKDQTVKLLVRDEITRHLQSSMADIRDTEQAKTYLQTHLPELEELANRTLTAAGMEERATVTLTLEAFPVRQYDTFTLPSGVYESLRITIGEGQGKNWWCVVFPSLCMNAAGEDFSDTAAGAGFSEELTGTLEGEQTYQVRFFILDLLGRLQNFFHQL